MLPLFFLILCLFVSFVCPFPPSCSAESSDKTGTEKKKWEPLRFIRRKPRTSFSDSVTSIGIPIIHFHRLDNCSNVRSYAMLDLTSLGAELKRIDALSPKGDLQDCSRTAEALELTNEASEESNSATDSEGQLSLTGLVHLRGFFRLLKKGPGIPSQVLPPLIPKLPLKRGKKAEKTRTFHSQSFRKQPITSAMVFPLRDNYFCNFNPIPITLTFIFPFLLRRNLIGQGGYAEVYKGQLKDRKFTGRDDRGFLSELGIMVHLDHPNIAKMIGYGVEGGMYLVLQLSPHGSLSSLLYGPKEKLTWSIRFKIAVGTAEGLSYLHEGCQRRIIHKDIKAANVLLSENFDAQISDFGLSKWLPDNWTHHTVYKVEGTFGYLAPELFMHGIVDEKTDVYAFGVLLLELITGRRAVDSSQKSLVILAKPLIAENKINELVDPALGNNYDLDQLKCAIATASICINQSSMDRPQMSMLKGDPKCLEMLKEQEKCPHRRTFSDEIFHTEEYNSTNCLNGQNSQNDKVS
ncbi:hypothetical protein CXB51_025673 [Gossypium anomalum]|uniref:non-specific serine/threonine protein kinase n=1 Tax=Gossypium anomalum TaxID=47600 RepID=A0A8J6CQK1_9ROSI|nr:hypothetical protein CXB51_025673 [Gossypium anomalum]